DRTVPLDKGDLEAGKGAPPQKSPRGPLSLRMPGNGGDQADLVARRAKELAARLVQPLAEAGKLAGVAGVDAAALGLDLDLDAVERGDDIAEAGLRVDDQALVASAKGAADLAAA